MDSNKSVCFGCLHETDCRSYWHDVSDDLAEKSQEMKSELENWDQKQGSENLSVNWVLFEEQRSGEVRSVEDPIDVDVLSCIDWKTVILEVVELDSLVVDIFGD